MPTVGEQLRKGREARGLTIAEVAETTKIMAKHLSDLEDGCYDRFAAPVYIRGFVRTYATMLKIDVRQVMAQLDEELSKTEKFREPPSLTGTNRGPLDFITLQLSRLNWRIVVPVVVVILLFFTSRWAYGLWQTRRAHDPLSNLGPGLYQPSSKPASRGELLPLTNAPARR